MNKIRAIKFASLIGAFFIGGSQIAGGDVTTGLGVILSALASAGAISPNA
jgi:hypothetical protein